MAGDASRKGGAKSTEDEKLYPLNSIPAVFLLAFDFQSRAVAVTDPVCWVQCSCSCSCSCLARKVTVVDLEGCSIYDLRGVFC